jgi:hypothetical protein
MHLFYLIFNLIIISTHSIFGFLDVNELTKDTSALDKELLTNWVNQIEQKIVQLDRFFSHHFSP